MPLVDDEESIRITSTPLRPRNGSRVMLQAACANVAPFFESNPAGNTVFTVLHLTNHLCHILCHTSESVVAPVLAVIRAVCSKR